MTFLPFCAKVRKAPSWARSPPVSFFRILPSRGLIPGLIRAGKTRKVKHTGGERGNQARFPLSRKSVRRSESENNSRNPLEDFRVPEDGRAGPGFPPGFPALKSGSSRARFLPAVTGPSLTRHSVTARLNAAARTGQAVQDPPWHQRSCPGSVPGDVYQAVYRVVRYRAG